MDLQALQQRALAARELTHTIGDIAYRLRVPTRHEVLLAAQRSGAMQAGGDRAALLVTQRAVVESAVVGWSGARVRHVLPPEHAEGEADAPLAWEAGAVPLLLDARPDDAQALADVINQRMAARAAAVEADAKN
jgi:hypothetical protein